MSDWTDEDLNIAETFPLLSSANVGAIANWAVSTLGLSESWRNEEDGVVAHAELHWLNGKVSINVINEERSGTMGVGLRLGSKESVERVYNQAKANGATFSRELADSVVAYSFTALDPDGNEWWVHAETGMLDQLRKEEA